MRRIYREYRVEIDTDQYSGNFEREMCAHITGQHDYYHGEELAAKVPADIVDLFEDVVYSKGDSDGHVAPCEAVGSPDGECNTVAIFFNKKPNKKMMKIIEERAFEYVESLNVDSIKIKKIRVIESKTVEVELKTMQKRFPCQKKP